MENGEGFGFCPQTYRPANSLIGQSTNLDDQVTP